MPRNGRGQPNRPLILRIEGVVTPVQPGVPTLTVVNDAATRAELLPRTRGTRIVRHVRGVKPKIKQRTLVANSPRQARLQPRERGNRILRHNPGVIPEEADLQLYKFGPCDPWDPIWPRGSCADILLDPQAPAVTGVAIQAASEVLYQLTGQRFGLCTVKLRPCRRSCFGTWPWWTWWEYGTYPQPYWWNGTWYNLTCNSCPNDSCSCVALEETVLPGPAVDVVEVKLNGVALTRNVDYRLDDYRKLVRLKGQLWPFCQDMNLDDTESNTWSVTALYGERVPALGQLAVGELGLEFVKAILCDEDCALPQNVVDVSRQGVSMTIARISDLFNQGFVSLRFCDLFIQSANPKHLQARSAVYDLDGPQDRAVGTW